jgi:hypothetical protein
MMLLKPTRDYRYAFRKGMSGTDVAALQLNFPSLSADGIFGEETLKAVRAYQKGHGLKVDGIAGLATQKSLVVQRSTNASRSKDLPAGMLPSIAQNESAFAVAACALHGDDEADGFDLGAFQKSIPAGSGGSQAQFRGAYTITTMADETAARLRQRRDTFLKAAAINPKNRYAEDFPDSETFDPIRFCWQLAVLSHNWPAAAEGIAERGSIFKDASKDDETEAWIVKASGGRLATPREWAIAYVERATALVVW